MQSAQMRLHKLSYFHPLVIFCEPPPPCLLRPFAPSHIPPRVFVLKRPVGGLTSISHFKKPKNIREDQEYREMKAKAEDEVKQEEEVKRLKAICQFLCQSKLVDRHGEFLLYALEF